MKKVLITGGSGFIGKQLIKKLNDNGDIISVIGRKSMGMVETYICDLESDNIPESAFSDVDTVFYLAGVAHDLNCTNNKKQYHKINVDATINTAKLAIKYGVRCFVYISSTKAGGVLPFSRYCFNETHQYNPGSIYGITKRLAEIGLLNLKKNTDMQISIIRPALIYGPEVKGNLHLMISGICRNWFPPVPKVSNKRSMVHVDDVVDSMLFVSNNIYADGEIYIITDGVNYSTTSIYDTIKATDRKPKFIFRFPKFIFYAMAKFGDFVKYIPFNTFSYNKFFGNECFSSKKINTLGFLPKRTFYNSILEIKKKYKL
jgi:UDP-glucose 4-epimerase